jgi:hypothetical protein
MCRQWGLRRGQAPESEETSDLDIGIDDDVPMATTKIEGQLTKASGFQ